MSAQQLAQEKKRLALLSQTALGRLMKTRLPLTTIVKKARKSSSKRAKKRTKRDEHQISGEHEMEKVGLALQQQQYLMSNALQEQNNRIQQ